MPNFILIGMPASGKSTLGKWLLLRYSIILLIPMIPIWILSCRFNHLIDQFGIDGFIELESKILQQVQVGKHHHCNWRQCDLQRCSHATPETNWNCHLFKTGIV